MEHVGRIYGAADAIAAVDLGFSWFFVYLMIIRIIRRLACLANRHRFRRIGSRVIFDPLSSYLTYARIEIGHNVFIGSEAYFSTTHSVIYIGSDVMFGPGVQIYGGNHRYDVIGRPMISVGKASGIELDQDVVIEDDVWIGGRAIVLSGVTIARGCIIGAGSVVTRSTTSYDIYAGNPARKIGERFDKEQREKHESTYRPTNS